MRLAQPLSPRLCIPVSYPVFEQISTLSKQTTPSMFARLFSLFSSVPMPPPEDADTIPCTAFDLSLREFTLTYGWVVNQQLDWEKLKNSLFELIETKIRKAGARLAFRNGVRCNFRFVCDIYEWLTPNLCRFTNFRFLTRLVQIPLPPRSLTRNFLRPMRLPRAPRSRTHQPTCPCLLSTHVPLSAAIFVLPPVQRRSPTSSSPTSLSSTYT